MIWFTFDKDNPPKGRVLVYDNQQIQIGEWAGEDLHFLSDCAFSIRNVSVWTHLPDLPKK